MRNFKPGVASFLLVLLLYLLASNIAYCEETTDKNLDSILNKVDSKFKVGEDSLMKHLTLLSKEDSSLRKALSEYQLFGLQHRMKTLQWNLTSSRIIFWCVIFLVFAGIVFAGLQFYMFFKATKVNSTGPAESLDTEMEVSVKGVKINSPVLGIIILMMSFLFFYLYLVYVYPVTEIF
jgi:hypothetical protein